MSINVPEFKSLLDKLNKENIYVELENQYKQKTILGIIRIEQEGENVLLCVSYLSEMLNTNREIIWG